MRSLARIVAALTFGVGALAAILLVIAGVSLLDSSRSESSIIAFAWALGVFLSAATAACILALLSSIDERLQVAGLMIASDPSVPDCKTAPFVIRAVDDDDKDENMGTPLNLRRAQGRS